MKRKRDCGGSLETKFLFGLVVKNDIMVLSISFVCLHGFQGHLRRYSSSCGLLGGAHWNQGGDRVKAFEGLTCLTRAGITSGPRRCSLCTRWNIAHLQWEIYYISLDRKCKCTLISIGLDHGMSQGFYDTASWCLAILGGVAWSQFIDMISWWFIISFCQQIHEFA